MPTSTHTITYTLRPVDPSPTHTALECTRYPHTTAPYIHDTKKYPSKIKYTTGQFQYKDAIQPAEEIFL